MIQIRSVVNFASLVVTGCLTLTSCASSVPYSISERGPNADMETMMQKMRLMQELNASPDLPAWHAQREKMAMAVGDRVIDKSFDRAFDSMIVALGNLGCRVNNMERVSGYITSSLPQLPPEQQDALHRQAVAQYAEARGYPPSVVGNLNAGSGLGGIAEQMLNPAGISKAMERTGAGLTLTMTRVGPTQTRVKIRFDNVYDPLTIQELYKKVWDALDKQIFLDKSVG